MGAWLVIGTVSPTRLGEGFAAIGLTPAETAWLEHGRHVLMGAWPVIATVSPAHLDEALAAAAIGLTSAEAAWLEHGGRL